MPLTKPIKSVHLTNYYHKNSGGISTAYNKLLEAANRHRRLVRLIVPGEKTAVEEVGEFGRIYFIKASYSRLFDKRYRVMMPVNSYILDKSPIKQILRDEKPDIIEIGEKYTLSLMAGLIRKGIMNVSETRPMLVHFSCERMDDNVAAFVSKSRIAKRVAYGYMRNYVFPMFDFHLANSDYTAAELFQSVDGERRRSNRFLNFCWRLLRSPKTPIGERINVNQCGVDTAAFSADRKSAEKRRQICLDHGLPENATLLLYAGRLSPEKNVMLLPEVMKRLAPDDRNDYRLIIAGAGPSSDPLASEFERTVPGKTRMLGHLRNSDEFADLMANCDAFLHPNPREPFGITPLEAMASGLPVIAPNSGGILSYANDGNAWLADADPESLAARTKDVFIDDERRAEKIRAALKTSARYDWEMSTASLFDLYDRMYAQFCRHREVFEYKSAPKNFNFAKESITNA